MVFKKLKVRFRNKKTNRTTLAVVMLKASSRLRAKQKEDSYRMTEQREASYPISKVSYQS
jgi:hypothetical protein